MKKSTEIKVEWCENWIRHTFKKYSNPEIVNKYGAIGIECNFFWELAEKSGLWTKGSYGSPMSEAISKLARVETRLNNGKFCYNLFKLA